MSILSFGDTSEAAAPAKTEEAAPATQEAVQEKTAPAEKTKESAPAPAPEAKQEVVAAAETTHALAAPGVGTNVVGEIDSDDIETPRLNLVNPLSPLKKPANGGFPEGHFVFNKTLDLGKQVDFVPLLVVKKYQQKVPYEGEIDANVVDTKAEVRAAGGTTVYSKEAREEMRFYEDMAHIVVLIKAPEGLDEDELLNFPEEFQGERWGKAAMTVSGGGYRDSARKLITALANKLSKIGLHRSMWRMTPNEHNGKNDTYWFTPAMRQGPIFNDPEVVAFLDEVQSTVDPSNIGTQDD